MGKNKFSAFIATSILLFATFVFSTPAAEAASCVPDWPANIFDNGYSGTALVGASRLNPNNPTDFTGGRQITIAIAPSVLPEIQSRINALGKDIKVSSSYISQNGLRLDYQIANQDPITLVGLTMNLFGTSGLAVQGVGRFYGTNGSLGPAFASTPGARLQSTVSVLTPGCEARTFSSNFVEVAKYVPAEISSSLIQADLKSVSTNFTQLDNLNRMAVDLNSTILNVDQYLQFQLPNVGDLPGNINIDPDWRQCKGVTPRTSNDSTPQPFKIIELSRDLDCTVPIYGFARGEIFTLATGKFHYSAPVVPSSKNSAQAKPNPGPSLKWFCVKGKSRLAFSGKSPICPSGYKMG